MANRSNGLPGNQRLAFGDERSAGDPFLGGMPPAPPENAGPFTRRNLLKWVIRLGYAAFAIAFVLPATALRSLSQRQKSVAQGDALVYAPTTSGAPVGQPLKATDLSVGVGVQVFPQGKQNDQNNLVEVVRIAEGKGAEGLVAYSAICTHLGCAVYSKLSNEGLIACPCHGSKYDPKRKAAVVGGPAPRPLPALPINVGKDGAVIVAGNFSGPIGIS